MYYDIIGDTHGCFHEFKSLTVKLGYEWNEHTPTHPDGRTLVFLGDITDRGPDSLSMITSVYTLVHEKKTAIYVPGNHCNKLYRFFLGRGVQQTHGLETTVAEYEALSKKQQQQIRKQFMSLYEQAPLYAILDDGKLICAHAGIRGDFIGQHSRKVETFVLYGDITGKTHPDGRPVRRDWAQQYKGAPLIVYGHTPVYEPRWVNETINIDTGCVFGGKLTALRYPERETVSVPSSLPFVEEKFGTFPNEKKD